MANVYNRGKANIGTVWDWDDAGQTFRLMLVTSAYVYSDDHNVRSDITGEITNTGYTAGGDAITGRTVTQDDTANEAQYDAAAGHAVPGTNDIWVGNKVPEGIMDANPGTG